MGKKMIVDEDKIFDACALVEEIERQLTSITCPVTIISLALEKASQASLLLNQAMKEGELI